MKQQPMTATAPLRVCDIGGWTDTAFATQGSVFNVPIYPGVTVKLIHNWGEPGIWVWTDCANKLRLLGDPEGDPIVNAVLQRYARIINAHDPCLVSISSAMPIGVGLGGSAALIVALLRMLLGDVGPAQLWRLAWELEAEVCERQTGVQDHIAAASGVPTLSAVDYPDADVDRVVMPAAPIMLYVSQAGHDSSAIHDQVIERIGNRDGNSVRALQRLKHLAGKAAGAARSGDWVLLGALMNINTSLQYELHPDLVPEWVYDAQSLPGVLGVKPNGSGGSYTVLYDKTHVDYQMIDTIMTTHKCVEYLIKFAEG